ncbi:MAG TPA: DUF475 domain-containing protein [Holophaga sp.]|mgnify:CR=1 FL=1|nr:DUF475 domain-containing protein [Holophaga sp.]HPS67157.1 DUF475 domain-containing protein [Holophaga sp.]
MKNVIRYFGGSMIFTVIALICAYFVGAMKGPAAGMAAVMTAGMLGLLETSLSFDNAVVNAKVLTTMNHFWRRMFITVGILVAVFGMRVVFPLVIVWAVGDYGLWSVVAMTWRNPMQFQQILVEQHITVAGFGGAFLWMVFTNFFFDYEKDEHWLQWLEQPMRKLGKIDSVNVVVTVLVSYVFSRLIPEGKGAQFLSSAMLGVVTYLLVGGFTSLIQSDEREEGDPSKATSSATGVLSTGFASFIYLETLDASFSFDGVIGAFALTNNLFIIALGLGIGAMFVRSLTIKLVEAGTLATYKFLEHGAFWAIGALSLIMYLKAAGIEIPEVLSGTVGAGLIGMSLVSSFLYNRKQKALGA